ncbi:MAG: hypothetical protein V1776_05090 [Candidatus Diapherotrites archaeon]
MRPQWVLLLFIMWVSFAPIVAGQIGGAGDTNGSDEDAGDSAEWGKITIDNPTPIHGMGTFIAGCESVSGYRNLIICPQDDCFPSTSNKICSSAFNLSSSKFCTAQPSYSNWGFTDIWGRCCEENGNCDPLLNPNVWMVDVSESDTITGSGMYAENDSRSNSIVRLPTGKWVGVYYNAAGPMIAMSSSGISGWSDGFSLKSIIPPASLPAGTSFSRVSVIDASLAIDPDGTVHLAFTVKDKTNEKSTIYYTQCASGNCGSASSWQTPTRILDPLLDETGAPSFTWKYSFGRPKIAVDGQYVHILFDDMQINDALRIDGIFHKYCLVSSSCASHSAWFSSLSGPDITQGVHNGNPRFPEIAVDNLGRVYAVWLDAYSSGPDSSLYFSLFNVGDGSWLAPVLLGSGAFSFPSIAYGNDSLLVVSRMGNEVAAYRCPSGTCMDGSISISPSGDGSSGDGWKNISSWVSSIDGLNIGEVVIPFVSQSDQDKAVLIAEGDDAGNRHILGLFIDFHGQEHYSFRPLSHGNYDDELIGGGDFFGSYSASGLTNETIAFMRRNSAGTAIVLSNILDFSNSPPVLSNLIPVSAVWQNTLSNPSDTPFKKAVAFTITDPDIGDAHYAKVYFGLTPGGEDYTINEWRNVDNAFNISCTASGDSDNCTINIVIFNPLKGLLVPEGSFYLKVNVMDSAGEMAEITSGDGKITVDGSQLDVTVSYPSPGAVWHSQNQAIQNAVFVMNHATFAIDLDVRMLAEGTDGKVVDLGSIDVANYEGVESICTMADLAFNCNTPVAIPDDLPEGEYSIRFEGNEDGFSTAVKNISGMVLDFHGPHIESYEPTGSVSYFPESIHFVLQDYSGFGSSPKAEVLINGAANKNEPVCTQSANDFLECVVNVDADILSFQSTHTPVDVTIISEDEYGNSSESSFSFLLVSESIPSNNKTDNTIVPLVPPLSGVVKTNDNGELEIVGTGIVIPEQIIETINNIANHLILSASDLVEVTGPSANAIFLGLCTLAGIASDMVFRRVFFRIVADNERQRQRLLRSMLGLVFFSIPLLVGWQFGLSYGFVFAILEVVFFVGAAYLFKLLQYYDTFGFKPIEPVQ